MLFRSKVPWFKHLHFGGHFPLPRQATHCPFYQGNFCLKLALGVSCCTALRIQCSNQLFNTNQHNIPLIRNLILYHSSFYRQCIQSVTYRKLFFLCRNSKYVFQDSHLCLGVRRHCSQALIPIVIGSIFYSNFLPMMTLSP